MPRTLSTSLQHKVPPCPECTHRGSATHFVHILATQCRPVQSARTEAVPRTLSTSSQYRVPPWLSGSLSSGSGRASCEGGTGRGGCRACTAQRASKCYMYANVTCMPHLHAPVLVYMRGHHTHKHIHTHMHKQSSPAHVGACHVCA
eukprot:1162039-Pelagomonas_calceolata.AAC.2